MHNIITNFFGITAAVGSSLMAVPQVIRSIKHGTRGVSSTTFQIFDAADGAWFIYSSTQHIWLGAIENLFCVATGCVVLYCLVKDGERVRDVSKYLALIAIMSAACGWINISLLALWGGGLSIALRIPQARKVFSRDDISGVSTPTWLISGVANGLWSVYGLLLNRPLFAFICAGISLFSFVLVVGVIRRRRTYTNDEIVYEEPLFEFEVA